VPERDTVLLVDESGHPLGASSKLAAHEAPGRLHLAFSVFLFRGGEMLLQQRALTKYHFPGLWANACCSHPAPGEEIASSARRRLREELGLEAELREAGSFLYRAEDPHSGLVEHELDHVFVGELPPGEEASPDPSEVAAVRWVSLDDLPGGLPEPIAPWFGEALGLAIAGREGASPA
jgi:isopentenyl-diphosphate delta-isomerase